MFRARLSSAGRSGGSPDMANAPVPLKLYGTASAGRRGSVESNRGAMVSTSDALRLKRRRSVKH